MRNNIGPFLKNLWELSGLSYHMEMNINKLASATYMLLKVVGTIKTANEYY